MSITVKDVFDFIDKIAPFGTQCDWDNAGLLIGSGDMKVSKVGVALDATQEVISDAIENNCDLLVTHHPVIFNPLKNIDFLSPAALCVKNNLPVISAHTNLDKAEKGVNFALASSLGLTGIKDISNEDEILFAGDTEECTADEFAKIVSGKLNAAVTYTKGKTKIRRVAVCGGAAGEYLYSAKALGYDAFVTGEVRHHEYLDANRLGISVFCAGHFETENVIVKPLAEMIEERFNVEVAVLNQHKPTNYCCICR